MERSRRLVVGALLVALDGVPLRHEADARAEPDARRVRSEERERVERVEEPRLARVAGMRPSAA